MPARVPELPSQYIAGSCSDQKSVQPEKTIDQALSRGDRQRKISGALGPMREPNTGMMPIGKPRLIKNVLQVGQDPDELGATPSRIREFAIVHSGLRVSRAGEFRRLSLRRDEADRQRECDSQCIQPGLHDFTPFSISRDCDLVVITRPRVSPLSV